MHLKSEDITRLEIDYQTGHLPAPFSHIFKLRMSFDKNFINTQFDIHYTEREGMVEEDITSEGFTVADDYTYKGEIPKTWVMPFKKLYSESKWSNQKTLGENGGVKLLAKDVHGKITRDIPLNQEEWYQLSQEFIQAIYEVSEKEAPLTIRYKKIEKEAHTDISLLFRFSVRKIELAVNGKKIPLEWEKGRELASLVYLPDYDYEVAKSSEPTNNGTYIDCGDGYWHEFGRGIFNLDEAFDAKAKILDEFEKLNQL